MRKQWGDAADVRRLVPYMLESFLASDLAYRKARRAGSAETVRGGSEHA